MRDRIPATGIATKKKSSKMTTQEWRGPFAFIDLSDPSSICWLNWSSFVAIPSELVKIWLNKFKEMITVNNVCN